MDERTEKARGALMTYHTVLRSGLLIENFLPALRPLLTTVEYSRVDDKGDNVAKIDELIRILLTKEYQHFEGFCNALANNGYKHWADKLRTGVDEPHRPSTVEVCAGRSVSAPVGGHKKPTSPLACSPRKPMEWVSPQSTLRTSTNSSTIMKLPPMPVEMQVITSLLHRNKVYVTGVSTDHVPNSRCVQVYSLEENTWSTLPESNYNAPIALINDRITLIVGCDAKSNLLTNMMPSWIEEEGEWRQILPSLPSKRYSTRVCHRGNLLLVAGGAEARTEEGEKGEVTNKVHVYNFSTMKWTTPQSLQLPKPLRSHYLIQLDDYIYLMGGAHKFLDRVDAVPKEPEEIHNSHAWRARWSDVEEAARQNAAVPPSQHGSSVWTPITAPPILRPTIAMCNNAIISVGGILDGKSRKAIYKLVVYETDSPHWIEVGSMSVGRYRHAVVPLGNVGAALFVAGGFVWVPSDEANVKSTSVELVFL